jgi:hypothetical protein
MPTGTATFAELARPNQVRYDLDGLVSRSGITIPIGAEAVHNVGNKTFARRAPRRNVVFSGAALGLVSDPATKLDPFREGRLINMLTSLRALRDGWMGESTIAPTEMAIEELVAAQGALQPGARVSPAADGSIVIEWETDAREFVVSIEHDNTIVFVEEDAEGNLIRESETAYTPDVLRRALSAGAAA